MTHFYNSILFSLLIVFFLSSGTSNAQNIKLDSIINNNPEGDQQVKIIFHYDQNNREILREQLIDSTGTYENVQEVITEYYSDGNIKFNDTYLYNTQSMQFEFDTRNYFEYQGDDIDSEYLLSYDSTTSDWDTLRKTEFQYDQGLLKQRTVYASEAGTLVDSTRSIYKYNSEDLVDTLENYDFIQNSYELTSFQVRIYDDQDRLSIEESYSVSGPSPQLSGTTEIKYDDEGNVDFINSISSFLSLQQDFFYDKSVDADDIVYPQQLPSISSLVEFSSKLDSFELNLIDNQGNILGNLASGVSFYSDVETSSTDIIPLEASVYPVPTEDYINIELEEIRKANVTIYNTAGEVVLKNEITQHSQLDLSDLAPGTYYYKITSAKKGKRGKLILH